MHEKRAKNQNLPLENDKNTSAEAVEKSHKKASKSRRGGRSTVVLAGLGICGVVGGAACAAVGLLTPKEVLPDLVFPRLPSEVKDNNIYSNLTGTVLASAAEVTAPTFCVQTPNGTDGARPQAGLNQAGVVFEAIAEAGITRFAAIYQNPTSAVIGPIRSLRLYYLQWDAPFDCTIVHAGGAPDALEAVRNYRDLTENYEYMYRGTAGSRLWNNLFTTASYLKAAARDRGYEQSNVNGFARMTPAESLKARVDAGATPLKITEPASGNTSEVRPSVSNIAVNFGGWATFNVRYVYDAQANTYLRSYETGEAHNIYACPDSELGEVNPESACQLQQLAPSVVAVMMVNEKRASDDYHEDITTVGDGKAYVFQNGQVIEGTWQKATVSDQIKFFDAKGNEVKLAPGQTFVEAVPTYGSVDYS